MHPILVSPQRRLGYFAAWLPLAAALAGLLVTAGGLTPAAAGIVALPVSVFYGAVCLATYYLCRARELRLARIPQVVGTHVGAAVVSASIAAGAGSLGLRGLRLLGLPVGAQPHPAVILFSMGLLLFLLASALHYAFIGYEHARASERRVLELQVLSREAELKTLRAQIHPHFLFNALNSISALTGSDPAAARRACVLLGDFLRKSLTVGRAETIPLREELALAEALLDIERVRFGERLAVQVEVEERARERPVPPLILQPLVENAVTHGIAGRLEGGTVSITGRLRGGRLELEVVNPRDAEAPPRRGAGVGLDNVRRRLAATYGDEAELVTRADPEAFHVRLNLPAG